MARRVVLRCPICGKASLHKLSNELIAKREQNSLGIIPILVDHIVCEHLFLIYVDAHMAIRNYMPVFDINDHPYELKIEEKKVLGFNSAPIKEKEQIIAC